MRNRIIIAVALLSAISTLPAQQYKKMRTRFELRPFAALYQPAGDQSRDFKSATTFGFQGAVEFTSFAHIVASGAYTDGRAKFGSLLSPKTTMWQYDIGAEFNALANLGPSYMLRPFLGVGAGQRSYKYDDAGIGTKSGFAGYAALGLELQRSVVAIRVETRSYLTQIQEPMNAQKWFRNDYSLMFGLALHLN